MVPMLDYANHDPRVFDWSERYLRERWDTGERNGTLLWEELKAASATADRCAVSRHASCSLAGASMEAGIVRFACVGPSLALRRCDPWEGRRVDVGPPSNAEPRGRGTVGSDYADG